LLDCVCVCVFNRFPLSLSHSPATQANFIFFAIVSGGIYFQEFNYMHPGQYAPAASSVWLTRCPNKATVWL
jgi:hypothetical protein